MDEQTSAYYSSHAGELAERYESSGSGSGIDRYFPVAFSRGMRVLDVGAGSGRDLSRLLAMGCEAFGVEPCVQLRELALDRHPELERRLASGGLPHLGQPFGGGFDGVLCSAVLMHLPDDQLPESAFAIRKVLGAVGRLLLSVPRERPGLDNQHRDVGRRLFTPLSPERIRDVYEPLGFQLIGSWSTGDSLLRQGHSWSVFLFDLPDQRLDDALCL